MQNNIITAINEAARFAKTYPELVEGMINIGIQSYTVDVATGTTIYRVADGEFAIKEGNAERTIASAFDNDATVQAIKDSQAGKITYPEFMDAIAASGVRFYEATLIGTKRVTYIGAGGYYEENIPV
jgi:uncharacterized protein YbcV (DUF1398 family)